LLWRTAIIVQASGWMRQIEHGKLDAGA
jgi:hypothetical protein